MKAEEWNDIPEHQSIKEHKERRKQQLLEKMEQIPAIHWEILKYANNHTMEEVLEKYPDYLEFINTIQ